jgi:hypothetical protein
MLSPFEDLNAYAYHRMRCVGLDLVIWCLGPVVDDTRSYGRLRRCLAIATCHACRRWYGIG